MISKLAIGTWLIGEDKSKEKEEIETINYAIDNGIKIIDTAEMYGKGKAEKLLGRIIENKNREDLYLISKIYPHNAHTKEQIKKSLFQSLDNLKTSYLDLYLLHWIENDTNLHLVVETFEELKKEGYLKNWGVSNFDVSDLERLYQIPNGKNCHTNQILYHIGQRGIEYDLIPYAKDNNLHLMFYSVLGHSKAYRDEIINSPAIIKISSKHHMTPYQVMLLFSLEKEGTSIIKASSIKHIKELIEVTRLHLDKDDLEQIDKVFKKPLNKVPLQMI
ncbi:Aldo/keto reductase family protein [Alteracholeplasma palmae J233]|uniref:Aldo/keto reductase family protein n=1 Tax=Alteracholeplasma palmae (strain ATCC 49389 / J233) TaxID=1318466 RepID=U4KQV4_ALTPJ|nr:aldo/keto reductase [Alteracholeplasma palmae]CCV63631.1 Aldo/keto reductase family protein [Alteracholeplasma palmae J233]